MSGSVSDMNYLYISFVIIGNITDTQGGCLVESLPELVVVPARPGPYGVEIETRHTAEGPDLVLPVFSSVANLVRLLGHDRPWICVSLRDARKTAAAAGLTRVVIDPEGMA
jgi:hypothetical protein